MAEWECKIALQRNVYMLKSNEVKLRDLGHADINLLYTIENDETLWKFGSERKYFSKQMLSEYIENDKLGIEINNQKRFIISSKNQDAGIIDIYNYNKISAGIGILVLSKYRRKGLATISLELIKEYCFKKLQLQELCCSIDSRNIGSIKLFLSSGFKETSEIKNIKYMKIQI